MGATIQSNQMNVDREEATPGPEITSLPQERHFWRIPEFSPIPQVPVQKLIQRSQGRGVENMPKPWAGGCELLLTHQEFSGSGEDHRTLRMMESIVFQRQFQKYKELVEEPKYLSIDQKKELKMTLALEKEGPVVSTSSRSIQGQAQRTSE
ncbi:hypothetical protein O181_024663 [Austropuccinia psidii MF-1]|uniref:Uncharacterized protein n=1 Tax=Austropuccinia psidii MF-1 TaxID=1389203 RepID=A0A9Q3CL71_9BASI|nr:hypothetical protein [Austropuccinia psidii MF-1]